MDVHEALAKMPALASLSAPDAKALELALTVERRPDAHVYIREGKRGDTAYLLLEGSVSVRRRFGHGDDEVGRLGPGEFFGLIALVDNERRSASCVGVGETCVATLPQSVFMVLFNAQAPVAFALQRALAEQLARDFRNLDKRIRDELAKGG